MLFLKETLLIRILLIISLLYPYSLFSKNIYLEYEIDWKSIHLADLIWDIDVNDETYDLTVTINSYGINDKIYKYRSVTKINGIIDGNQLRPLSYDSFSKSRSQNRHVSLVFNESGEVISMDLSKEFSKEEVELQNELLAQYQYFTDPITQLVQYFLFESNTDRMILDGLNIYKLDSKMLPNLTYKPNNPTIFNGEAKSQEIFFEFFQGLQKKDKKNNMKKILVDYFTEEKINIPIKFQLQSTKFNANLYLKNYLIN